MRQTKAAKALDKRIEQVYYKSCSGIAINMLDIPKVFREGKRLAEQGLDDAALGAGLRAFVESIAA